MTTILKSYFRLNSQLIRITGAKAATFLHGQFTNSITDLLVGASNYNLFLTNKGKVLADLYIVNRGELFDLIVNDFGFQAVFDHLNKLAPLSRCTVTPTTDVVFYFFGEVEFEFQKVRTDRFNQLGFDVIVPKDAVAEFTKKLASENFQEMRAEEVELLRIKNGVAKVGIDVTADNLPQEGRLDAALHFKKGCYLGQETIARLHFRGHVNKVLTAFSCEAVIAAGNEITDAHGAVIGKVTSAARDGSINKTYALGYVPAKSLEASEDFFVSKSLLKVFQSKVELP